MPLPNGHIGIKNNPLLESPFIQPNQDQINLLPPGENFLITDDERYLITDNGKKLITD